MSYGSGPAEAQYKAAKIWMWYFADKDEPILPVIERLASLPFDAQPGEKYIYGFNTDILGAVIEKASGMPLDEFFRARVFEPLKMVDTSFFLPPAKRDRLAAVYLAKDGGAIERAPDPQRGQGDYVDGPRKCFSGGAGAAVAIHRLGLRAVPADAGNGGELDGQRLLSPKTVELATSNHLGTLFNEGKTGFGLGFEIVEHVGRSGRLGSVGEFSWGGAYYTSYWADPQEQIVAVFMSQMLPAGNLDLQGKFRALVYQSVVGPPTGVPAAAPRRTTSR